MVIPHNNAWSLDWCYLIIIFAWSLGWFYINDPCHPSIILALSQNTSLLGWRKARPSKAPWRCFGWIFAARFLRDFLVEATNFLRKHKSWAIPWIHTSFLSNIWEGKLCSAMHSEGSFFSVTQGPGDQRYERGRSTRMVSSGLYLNLGGNVSDLL